MKCPRCGNAMKETLEAKTSTQTIYSLFCPKCYKHMVVIFKSVSKDCLDDDEDGEE